jgi:hypothetical protein
MIHMLENLLWFIAGMGAMCAVSAALVYDKDDDDTNKPGGPKT